MGSRVIFGLFWGHFLVIFRIIFWTTFWTTFGYHFGADGPGVILTAGLGVFFYCWPWYDFYCWPWCDFYCWPWCYFYCWPFIRHYKALQGSKALQNLTKPYEDFIRPYKALFLLLALV